MKNSLNYVSTCLRVVDTRRIGKGRLTNDALIAMSAGRLGITVITGNTRDFGKLAEFKSFHWQVENPRTN